MLGRCLGPNHAQRFGLCRPAGSLGQHIVRLLSYPAYSWPEYLRDCLIYFKGTQEIHGKMRSSKVVADLPSLLTTIVPTTPLCEAIRFSVSSTSCDCKREEFVNNSAKLNARSVWIFYHYSAVFLVRYFCWIDGRKNCVWVSLSNVKRQSKFYQCCCSK